MQSQIDSQIASLQTKLQQLLRQYQALQKENEQLKKQLTEANNAVNTKTDKQLSFNISYLTASNNVEERELLQKRIDKYLQEIDKCLLLLNANV